MNLEEKKKFLINISFVAVVAGIIFFVFKFLLGVLLPFLIGVLFAYAVQSPAQKFCYGKKINKGIFAAFLAAALYLIVLGLIFLIGWFVFGRIGSVIDLIPKDFGTVLKSLSGIEKKIKEIFDRLPVSFSETAKEMLSGAAVTLTNKFAAFFSGAAANTARALPSFLISTVVTIVASCYIAKDFDRLVRFFKNLIKEQTFNNFLIIKNIAVECVIHFILGYLLLMSITFIELTIGLLILKVRFAPLKALVIAVIDVLPVLGTGTVILPWAFLSFLSGKFSFGAGLIVMYILITVIRNFSEPRIIGKQIGINPLLTLITMFAGLRFAGLAGMLLVPLTTIIIITFYKRQMENG